jgi:hypothetical protein
LSPFRAGAIRHVIGLLILKIKIPNYCRLDKIAIKKTRGGKDFSLPPLVPLVTNNFVKISYTKEEIFVV